MASEESGQVATAHGRSPRHALAITAEMGGLPELKRSATALNQSQWDVAVIGAGIAGALAAQRCAAAGLKTLLVEREQFPRAKVCGCCLNGRALQIIDRLGLGTELAAIGGTALAGLWLHYGRRRLELTLPGGRAISRRRLDQWLVEKAIEAGASFCDDVTALVEPYADERAAHAAGDRASRRPAVRENSAAARFVQLRGRGLARAAQTPGTGGEDRDGTAADIRVAAQVVLVCDGLGHPSLQQLSNFREAPRPGARIGLGAVFARDERDLAAPPGMIQMVIGKRGYVGLVQIEEGMWNLAAAIDAPFLKTVKSPHAAVGHLLDESGFPIPRGFAAAHIKGTLPLTRRSTAVAAHRLLLVGDATGYVEPFSGEGMAWAAAAGCLVAPWVSAAVREGWRADTARCWERQFSRLVRREQRTCQWLTRALHQPRLLPLLFGISRACPGLADFLIQRINRTPAALESWA